MDNITAKMLLQKTLPETRIKSWTKYKDLYLFRVKHPFPGEEDYDPFFSVNSITNEVRDFSILTDIDSNEFLKLQWNDI